MREGLLRPHEGRSLTEVGTVANSSSVGDVDRIDRCSSGAPWSSSRMSLDAAIGGSRKVDANIELSLRFVDELLLVRIRCGWVSESSKNDSIF
jgi:hypothetical protein